ncbi:glycosyltransferase family 87 protein [Celeribacter neptunius]|nr:glycosyltransferase family 87 protein [Celeribacter neptunius]
MQWNAWSPDFSAYYFAGHFYGLEQFDQIYAGPPTVIGPDMPAAWAAAVDATASAGAQTYPFIYPPWVAASAAPIAAHLSPQAAMNAMLLLNTGLILASAVLAWRIAGRRRICLSFWMIASCALLALNAIPIFAVYLGQLQIFIFFLCLLAFDRYKSGKDVSAALLLALAACLKITPAAFAILFLWNRNWRALLAFMLASLGGLALSIHLLGWPLHATFFERLRTLNGLLVMSDAGVPLEAFLYQIADLVRGTAPIYDDIDELVSWRPLWIDLVTKTSFILGLALIWWRMRHLPRHRRIGAQILPLSILVPLATPLAWVHYFLLPCYLMVATLIRGPRPARYLALLFFAGFTVPIFRLVGPDTPIEEARVMPHVIFYVPLLSLSLFATLRWPLGQVSQKETRAPLRWPLRSL